mmetsp:Transcript_62719/g.141604  ORF Transcript_62719/g.141604 Transcript_62719/m.141604 type:complete len:464 (+) Transcript_62719:48-1439(+)|eukprot:CAMPEP_0197893282 /NCGR_PEP_ID=MMETSP1439-20131203/32671_1 /TAXON_ID=66791 /ORGANISM="Gonyaulax spinifera, Strain CCMP409" /LENGTH=463 /DNA_ID=CAMNT_0043513545 /DNA_START=48 /DNA_END=1439 /DNA_ORIENTATION=-
MASGGSQEQKDGSQDAEKKAKEGRGGCRARLARTRKIHKSRMRDGVGHPVPIVRRLVLSSGFEIIMSVLIVLNCVAIAWRADLPSNSGVQAQVSEGLQYFFTVSFLLELLLRMVAWGWTMILDSENHLDIFLVTLGVVGNLIMTPAQLPGSEIVRKLTVLRTLRLVRLATMVRFRPEFKDMWSLLQGLKESFETLVWTYVMMGCVLYFFAILATSLIGKQDAFKDVPIASEYFGDVLRSMLTLFQVMTLDSWSDMVRELMAVQAWVVVFFLVFISIAVFVLMNLVTAIIVEHAFTSGKADERDRAIRAEREKDKELEQLEAFFQIIDKDGNGMITMDELTVASKNRRVEQRFEKLGVSMKELEELWEILDDGDGELNLVEFIDGIRKLKGEAKAKDVMHMAKELLMLETSVQSIDESMDVSRHKMKKMELLLSRTRTDIAALHRTMTRAKDAVKLAPRTQALQ